MDNKLMLENYLLILKSSTEVFVHGTLESSNEKVRTVLKSTLGQILDSQNKCYNKMVENNWYKVNNIDKEQIDNILNKVNNSN